MSVYNWDRPPTVWARHRRKITLAALLLAIASAVVLRSHYGTLLDIVVS